MDNNMQGEQGMSKTLVVLLVILILLLLGGGAWYWWTQNKTTPTPTTTTPTTTTPDEIADWKTYTFDNSYKFSFKYPKDWKVSLSNIDFAKERKKGFQDEDGKHTGFGALFIANYDRETSIEGPGPDKTGEAEIILSWYPHLKKYTLQQLFEQNKLKDGKSIAIETPVIRRNSSTQTITLLGKTAYLQRVETTWPYQYDPAKSQTDEELFNEKSEIRITKSVWFEMDDSYWMFNFETISPDTNSLESKVFDHLYKTIKPL